MLLLSMTGVMSDAEPATGTSAGWVGAVSELLLVFITQPFLDLSQGESVH